MKLDPSAFQADPDLIKAIEERAAPTSYQSSQVLFRQGDPPNRLFFIKKGQVKLSMSSPAGDPILTIQADPGSILGLPGVIGNEPYSLTAITGDDAELSSMTRDEFTSLMRSDPFLSLKVLQVLAAEVRSARKAILDR